MNCSPIFHKLQDIELEYQSLKAAVDITELICDVFDLHIYTHCSSSHLRSRLDPGDFVYLSFRRHPVAAADDVVLGVGSAERQLCLCFSPKLRCVTARVDL